MKLNPSSDKGSVKPADFSGRVTCSLLWCVFTEVRAWLIAAKCSPLQVQSWIAVAI